MKTNLIFKRSVQDTNGYRVETKIIPVNIPQIVGGEGWSLAGHTDTIEIVPETTPVVTQPEVASKVEVQPGQKYLSTVKGNAKLVRVDDTIKIAYRRGKTTLNQNTPNSVCIGEADKTAFFKTVRAFNGGAAYRIDPSCKDYEYWNKFIDTQYERGRVAYNAAL